MTKLSEVQDGDYLIADGGFICLEPNERSRVHTDERGYLYVLCRHGRHLLIGQLADDNDTLVGLSAN